MQRFRWWATRSATRSRMGRCRCRASGARAATPSAWRSARAASTRRSSSTAACRSASTTARAPSWASTTRTPCAPSSSTSRPEPLLPRPPPPPHPEMITVAVNSALRGPEIRNRKKKTRVESHSNRSDLLWRKEHRQILGFLHLRRSAIDLRFKTSGNSNGGSFPSFQSLHRWFKPNVCYGENNTCRFSVLLHTSIREEMSNLQHWNSNDSLHF